MAAGKKIFFVSFHFIVQCVGVLFVWSDNGRAAIDLADVEATDVAGATTLVTHCATTDALGNTKAVVAARVDGCRFDQNVSYMKVKRETSWMLCCVRLPGRTHQKFLQVCVVFLLPETAQTPRSNNVTAWTIVLRFC